MSCDTHDRTSPSYLPKEYSNQVSKRLERYFQSYRADKLGHTDGWTDDSVLYNHIFQCMGKYFVWNFRGVLWNSTQNIFPFHWEMCILLIITHITHWGRVAHMCVVNLTIIGSDNGLSPGRRQAIIRTNVVILLIGVIGTNFSEI